MEVVMKLKAGLFAIAAMALALIPSAGSAMASPAQEQAGATMQQKIDSLKELRDAGLITQDEYQAKVNALRGSASAPVATAHAGPLVWPRTRTVQIADPEHNGMLAETLQVPANWKFAGTVDRSGSNTWMVDNSAGQPAGKVAARRIHRLARYLWAQGFGRSE
jgi:hypothetical protein